MTTGKQQMAEPSNSSDDLIAELSRLMAQDAQGSRQEAAAPKEAAARPVVVPAPAQDQPAAPFTVRIPGANVAAPESPSANAAPPPPRFDFGRAVAPVATLPRAEPSFAAGQPAVETFTPVSTDEPAPFNFDFDFGQQKPQPQPAPVAKAVPAPVAPVAITAPQAADVPASAEERDTIADLIAAELAGGLPAAMPPVAAPVNRPVPVEAAKPVAVPPEPAKLAEVPKPPAWSPKAVNANPADRPAQARPTLRPVNLTPVPKSERSESDSFRVAPVFGLGTGTPPAAVVPVIETPVAVAKPRAEHGYLQPVPSGPVMPPPADDPPAGLDPIEEIESLIGRAVRVELDPPREAQAQPERPIASPALRSLATPMVKPHNGAVSGADEAILAAAAATGAEVGWVEHSDEHQTMTADEPRRGRERAPRRGGMLRSVAGPLVAVALLLAAGFGLYSVLGLGRTDGPAPVLIADTTPIKVVPEAKTPVEPLQQSIVFNEMDGVVPGAEEQLVSRDQADVNEVTAIPPTAAVTDEGLANRKVRTVTVRPDGTIVSGGAESVAGAAILPVDRPNVPAVPGAAEPSAALLASAQAAEPTPAAVVPSPAPVVTVAPLVPGTEIAVVNAAGAPVAGKTAPVPYARPASVGDAPPSGPVNAIVDTPAPSLQPVAGQLPQAAPPAALNAAVTGANSQEPARAAIATTAPTVAPAYAQLSSQRSPEVAQQIATDLSARYASLLNGAQLEVVRADLGSRGIYYRVRVPAASQSGAAQLCTSIKATGGDCVAM